MKNPIYFFLLFLFIIFGITVNSCEKEGKCAEKNISNSSKSSHNAGQNCMKCHISGGEGEGCFNVAGSLYKSDGSSHSGGTMYLYTGPNGTGILKYSLDIDKSGSFYSTDNMDINGLYPAIKSNNSSTIKYMGGSISNGACNACHNNTTGKIWAN